MRVASMAGGGGVGGFDGGKPERDKGQGINQMENQQALQASTMQASTTTTLQTTIHTYRYNLDIPEEKQAYKALCESMRAQGVWCFETWGGKHPHYRPELNGLTLELETKFLFNNQWNTAPVPGVSELGLRVFDWAQDYIPVERGDERIKKGHWLEQTPAMKEARENRLKCGYCGKQYDKRDTPAPPAFCHACLGNEYLKAGDLGLLRLRCVADEYRDSPPLSAEEEAYLMPLYQAEQAGKGSERSRLQRAKLGERIQQEYDKAVQEATAKYEGMTWLFNRGCGVRLMENCIYYAHKGVFTFGWREKLEEGEDLDWLMREMSEFPWDYNIETKHRGCIGGVE